MPMLSTSRRGVRGFTWPKGPMTRTSCSVPTTRYRSHDEALGCHTHVNQVKWHFHVPSVLQFVQPIAHHRGKASHPCKGRKAFLWVKITSDISVALIYLNKKSWDYAWFCPTLFLRRGPFSSYCFHLSAISFNTQRAEQWFPLVLKRDSRLWQYILRVSRSFLGIFQRAQAPLTFLEGTSHQEHRSASARTLSAAGARVHPDMPPARWGCYFGLSHLACFHQDKF